MIRFDIREGGKIIRSHRGRGCIHANNGALLRCSFHLVQYADGDIRVFCPVSINDTGRLRPQNGMGLDLNMVDENSTFEGTTREGLRVELRGFIVTKRSLHSTAGKPVEIGFVLDPTHAELTRDTTEPPSHIRFQLVNFDFITIPGARIVHPSGMSCDDPVLPVTCNGRAMFLQNSSGRDVVKQLEANNGVDVTCEALAFLSALEEVEAIEKDISLLCVLLTLLQGTRINWVNYDVMGASGEIVSSVCQNAVTRPFSSNTILNRVDPAPFHQRYGGQYLQDLIERMCPRLIELEEAWELRGLINTYNDAVSEQDFVELRGLKIGGCMEILRARFLALKDEVHLVRPHSKFLKVVPELKKRVLKDLKELLPDEDSENLKMMINHLQGANYYPFRRALRGLLEEIGLKGGGTTPKEVKKATEAAISAFISIRDQLVHTGEFLVPTEADGEAGWSQERILSARWNQLQFMERFVGCVLVSLLGWPQTLPAPPDMLAE